MGQCSEIVSETIAGTLGIHTINQCIYAAGFSVSLDRPSTESVRTTLAAALQLLGNRQKMAEAADRLIGTLTTAVTLVAPSTLLANRPSRTANHQQYTKQSHEGRIRDGLAVADVMPDLQSCLRNVSCQLVRFMFYDK